MPIRPGLQRVRTLDVEALRREAGTAGFTTFVLPPGIVDRSTFFDAVRATFPLDPPLLGSRSWDALSDSLWEGLFRHAARRLAILWPGTGAMAKRAPVELDTALDVLAEVASLLADPRVTCGSPNELAVVVEADGDPGDEIESVGARFLDGTIPVEEVLLHIEPALEEWASGRAERAEAKRIVDAIERIIFTEDEPRRSLAIAELLAAAITYIQSRSRAT